ncbi:MAG: hypothetical protein U0Q22_13175 [Acidimicrobiales bacterium]
MTATVVPRMQRRLPVIGIGQAGLDGAGLDAAVIDAAVIDLRDDHPLTVERVRPSTAPGPALLVVPDTLVVARPSVTLPSVRTPSVSLPALDRATVALALSGWIAAAAFALPPGSAVRFLVTWGFIFTCPGLALTAFARLRDPLERAVYSLAGSGALAALVSMFFVLVDRGSAMSTVLTLAALTSVGAVLAGRRETGTTTS